MAVELYSFYKDSYHIELNLLIILDENANQDKSWLNMQAAKTKAGIGMQVEIELLSRTGEPEKMTFTIVPDESSDYGNGYLGVSTPLAKALAGKCVGETIPYPRDELYAVRILCIELSSEAPLADLAAKRQTQFNKAVRDVERTNAINFASSFSGKWGDYDPDSIPKDQDNE